MKSGKGLALLLGDPEDKAKDESDDDMGGEDGKDAAQDILDAIKENDAKALDMALQRHYESCE